VFPILFDLTADKDISVFKVLSSDFEALSFRRRMTGDLLGLFDELVALCSDFSLSSHEDKPVWRLGKRGSLLILCIRKILWTRSKFLTDFFGNLNCHRKLRFFYGWWLETKSLLKII
jgi:hypothetical protein